MRKTAPDIMKKGVRTRHRSMYIKNGYRTVYSMKILTCGETAGGAKRKRYALCRQIT